MVTERRHYGIFVKDSITGVWQHEITIQGRTPAAEERMELNSQPGVTAIQVWLEHWDRYGQTEDYSINFHLERLNGQRRTN